MNESAWLLPDGVDEFLPPQAEALEALRRQLLDLYSSWGYQLVLPPLIEYLDSLLVGAGKDLALETVKVTDQLSGKLMGVRADITPQVARIDAHAMQSDGVNRFCYANTVLRAKPQGLTGSRIPYQIGVEFFGENNVRADAEVMGLMLATLERAQARGVVVDIGHVAIFNSMCAALNIDEQQHDQLVDIYQRKAQAELDAFCAELSDEQASALQALAQLSGDQSVLDKALSVFADEKYHALQQAISQLKELAAIVSEQFPEVSCYFDLAELRGFAYHTGFVFAAYCDGVSDGKPIALGGRYDQVAEHYGRERAATGFSADLKKLALLAGTHTASNAVWLALDEANMAALNAKAEQLRSDGYVVLAQVGQESAPARCAQQLIFVNGAAVLQPL